MKKLRLLLLVGMVAGFSQSTLGEELDPYGQTLLEVGAGISVVDIPHYAGSEQSKSYALPFPFFNYQSKKVSLNRDGLKRYLLKGKDWDLDLSFSGTIPVDSDDNRARQGMPDLDWVGLAGPAFNYRLFQNNHHVIKLNVPLRFGIATDFTDLETVGWDFSPKIQWRYSITDKQVVWNTVVSAALEYAGADYNGYYYSVGQQYATELRNEYQAKSGYGGYKLTFGINRREGRFWMGAFTRYRNLSDATFADSPLVTADENFYVGVAAAWIFMSNQF